jgi:cytochrome bd-type quinol oxidase subunit 2
MEIKEMNSHKNEKIYEKYAWIIFFVIGAMTLVTAVFHALGINTDPALVESIAGKSIDALKSSDPMFFNLYNFYFSSGGLSDIGFAFLLTVTSMTAYRRGDKWAWYAFWFVPAFFLGFATLNLTLESSSSMLMLPPLMMFIILSLVGLLLPYRKFFPSKPISKHDAVALASRVTVKR